MPKAQRVLSDIHVLSVETPKDVTFFVKEQGLTPFWLSTDDVTFFKLGTIFQTINPRFIY